MNQKIGFFGALEDDDRTVAASTAVYKEQNRTDSYEARQHVSGAEKELLQQIRSDDAVKCFGGYLFRDTDGFGHPILRFAVPDMTPTEIDQASEWYDKLGRLAYLGFLHRTSSAPQTAANYTVFDFEIGNDDQTLGELHSEDRLYKNNPELIMRRLVNFLHSYSLELGKSRETYIPLCCLSMDTLIMNADGRMRLLPLRSHRQNYPVEIPTEVMHNNADERSDLYSAAYVAVEIYSANRTDGKLAEPKSDLIQSCLKTIRDWRPTLQEVYNQLRTESGNNGPKPIIDQNGNRKTVREQKVNDEDKPGLFERLHGKLRNLSDWIQTFEEPETTAQLEDTVSPDEAAQRSGSRRTEPQPEDGTFSPGR